VSSRKAAEELLGFLEANHTQYQFGISKVTRKLQRMNVQRNRRQSVDFKIFMSTHECKVFFSACDKK
jgi:hypothetical protein